MKKVLKISAVLLCLCYICANLTVIPVFAEPKVIVSQDYEDCKDGDVLEGWAISHESKEEGLWGGVVEDPENPGNKVMAIAGNATLVKGILKFKPVAGDVTVKYRVRLPYLYNDCHYIGIIPDVLTILTFQDTWNLWDGEQQIVLPNVPVQYDTWLDIEYNIRFSDHTFDIICNGSYWAENYKFANPDLESIDNMYWANVTDVMYIDDIVIESAGELKTVYTKIESPSYNVYPFQQTIKNIDFETTVEEFLSNIIFVEGAVAKVLNPDGTPYTGRYIVKNLQLDVSSPEGDQQKKFQIHSKPWVASLITVDYCSDAIVFAKNSNDAMIMGNKNYINPNDAEVKVFEDNGKTYIPLRFLAEQKGYKVEWIADEGAVEFNDVRLIQSDSSVTKKSQRLELDGKCINKNGTIYVPCEWIEKIFDLQVRTHNDIVIVKDDISFGDSRMEKLALKEITARFK